jgi:RNA polymerase sigma-70 factor (ECF subfamily)
MTSSLTALLRPGGVVDLGGSEARAETRPWNLRDIYEAHWSFVWRALRAHGVRDADLEDQTHEVFLVVHRKLAGFEGRSELTTWLWGIAERVASDWRRRAHVRREQITAAPPEPSARPENAPDTLAAEAQARETLGWILDAMPDEQRVVFALFELDGVAADEIATLVGCPLNTVHSRLRLARRNFEKALARVRARSGR